MYTCRVKRYDQIKYYQTNLQPNFGLGWYLIVKNQIYIHNHAQNLEHTACISQPPCFNVVQHPERYLSIVH